MALNAGEILLVILISLALIAIPLLLQYFLSTRKNRWFGLVLPGVFMLYSIIMMLQVTIFSFDSVFEVFLQMLVVFLLCNIPTLVLVVVYAACRSKMERRAELEKMQLNDLE